MPVPLQAKSRFFAALAEAIDDLDEKEIRLATRSADAAGLLSHKLERFTDIHAAHTVLALLAPENHAASARAVPRFAAFPVVAVSAGPAKGDLQKRAIDIVSVCLPLAFHGGTLRGVLCAVLSDLRAGEERYAVDEFSCVRPPHEIATLRLRLPDVDLPTVDLTFAATLMVVQRMNPKRALKITASISGAALAAVAPYAVPA
jgi:hypothetical protein